MDLHVSLTWLLLLSATLLSEPASGFWWNSPGSSTTGGQNSLWDKFSDWIKDKFGPKVPEEPQLRLVSGGDRCSGRVEVYHEGKWGTVCDDLFNMNSGSVVCRQLNCGQIVSVMGWSYFGPGSEDILLDDVQCRGTESYLWDCQHAGWGTHNCGHNEDVGVICSESTTNLQTSTSASTLSTDSTVVTSTTEPPTSAGKDSSPSSSPAETETWSAPGTLTTLEEVTASASTTVIEENATSAPEVPTTVYEASPDSTELASTAVTEESSTSEIPTMLQTASENTAEPAISPIPIINDGGTSTAEIPSTAAEASTNCSVTETDDSITSAPVTDSTEPVTTPASLPTLRDADTSALSLRLADGDGRCSGRVELYHNGSWGTVCDDGWELADAEVVCRTLGCGEALLAVSEAQFGPGSGNILLDDVQCRGDEDNLWECSHRGIAVHNCRHKEDASVICAEPVTPTVTTEPVPADMSLRLVNGEDMCSGRLEVFHNGSWATVCDDDWDMKDATVVCRQLGCGEAVSAKIDAFFGEGTGGILLDNVACTGDESSLEQCSHRGVGTHDCYHKEDAGVICEVPRELTTPEATVPTEPRIAETSVTVSPTPEPEDVTTSPAENTTPEAADPTESMTAENKVTNSSVLLVSPTSEAADVTTSPAENTTPEAAVPTESTTAENTVTNSSSPPVTSTPEAAAVTIYRPRTDPAPTGQAQLAYLPSYMRLMLLRYLTGLCGPRRPGLPSVKLQGCVRDPTCGSYYSPGSRIVRFKFRGSIYPRVCLRCKVLACNRYSYSSQRYQVYRWRGKRSASYSSDGVIIIIIPE